MQKHYLQELILDWDIDCSNKDPIQEESILESLRPHINPYKLSLKGHGGGNCPSWLGVNLSGRTLESLQLCDVPWTNFPPLLGEVWLIDEHGADCKSHISGESFKNLKRLELVNISKPIKWVGNGPCELFSQLKVLIIKDYLELLELPFSHGDGYDQEDELTMTWFPNLEDLKITVCPKLSSLPSIPWSSATCSVTFAKAGYGIERLSFRGYSSTHCAFWMAFAFHILSKLGVLCVTRCPPLSPVHLKELSSLKALEIIDSSDAFCLKGEDHVGYQCPAECHH
jgi:hypothetical protein